MLKLKAEAETGFWGLIRGNIAAGGHLQRMAEALLDIVKPPKPVAPAAPPQRALWVIDGEGLPPRPWRVGPDDRFDCVALGCRGLEVRVCIARQQASQAQRMKQHGRRSQWASRGQASEYPHCVTETCQQGRGFREALDPVADVAWRGRGPGGRFERGVSGPKRWKSQLAARQQQAREGLLEPVRVLDIDGDPVEREGEEA
jgi:hypothetical protein